MPSKRLEKKDVFPRSRVSPGSLYGDIKVSSDIGFEEEDFAIPKIHWFVLFCRRIHSSFKDMGKGASYTKEYQKAIGFLGWDLKAEEFASAIKGILVLVILGYSILAILLGIIFNDSFSSFLGTDFVFTIIVLLIPGIILGIVSANYVQKFPLAEANREQIKALTYVPEIVGYLIMSMKLVPNLERAVSFSAEHGKGRISDEFKKIIWNAKLGVYNTISEGLDDLAYKWGDFSQEFKQALMNIRASVLENTEAKRFQLLDKTMDDVLEGVQEKMEQYARDLAQPSTLLFYMGVLLPLILIIILPVGSAFSGSPLAQSWVLFLVYDIFLPLLVIWFGFKLLSTRPPTYTPPVIPHNFPGLPPKNTVVVRGRTVNAWTLIGGILVIGLLASTYIHFFGVGFGEEGENNSFYLLFPDKTTETVLGNDRKPMDWFEQNGTREKQLLARGFDIENARKTVGAEKTRFFAQAENDVTPYNFIFGFLITISFVLSVYIGSTTIPRRNVQERFIKMESEFKDSLYILASRLGENKPIEDALRHAQTFLPNNIVSREVFGKTVDNIHVLGMPLESAIFDPAYGSLKNNPSQIIHSSMRIAIDSVRLGVGVAARTLISLSRQLANSERVNKMLTILIKDITGTMKLVAVYIAPIVLGITTSLQRIVIVTLANIGATASEAPSVDNLSSSIPNMGTFQSTNITSLIDPASISSLATPGEFMLIVAIYVIELVIIMSYFITLIEENNPLKARIEAGKYIPIAVILFVITSIISNALVAGNFGA